MNRQATDLAGQVVERDVDRTLRCAVMGDPRIHRGRGRGQAFGRHVDVADGPDEHRQEGRHRLRRLPVIRIRVALPHSDDAGEPFVP
jgi:hypothetical protein